jgi:hypothetical protein
MFIHLPVQAMVWLFHKLGEWAGGIIEKTKVNICFDKIKYVKTIYIFVWLFGK